MVSFIPLLLSLVLIVLCTDVQAADRRRDAECQRIEEQIRKIESRMRRPYSAAQGIRYDERLRELKEKRYRPCR